MTTATLAADRATPAAKDNLFGICAAIGEDFGFNPFWLRVAFAVSLLFSLEGAIGGYAALGLVVLTSRLLAPNPKTVAAPEAEPPVTVEAEEEPLRRAA